MTMFETMKCFERVGCLVRHLILAVSLGQGALASERPNVVIFKTDDQGTLDAGNMSIDDLEEIHIVFFFAGPFPLDSENPRDFLRSLLACESLQSGSDAEELSWILR